MLNYSITELYGYDLPIFEISALNKQNLESLKEYLVAVASDGKTSSEQTIVTNVRHYQSLQNTNLALQHALDSLNNKNTGDLLAQDIRHALHALGEITGQITTDDLLDNIFSKFCIGK